jgi:alkylhydroperoxidase family enzyme
LVRKGLNDAEVQAAVGDLDATGEGSAMALLPPKTVAALHLVDLLVTEHPAVDDEAYRRLRADFEDGELLELSAAIVIGSGWQKMIEAFGIRPDHWTDTTPLPWKGER